jgi:hypothetical protein
MPRASTLLDGGIVLSGALALLAWMVSGVHIPLAVAALSVRQPLRPALVCLVLSLIRHVLARHRPGTVPPALPHLPLLALTATGIGYAVTYLTTVSGGADSYGYVSAAHLIRTGTLSVPQPEAAWLPADHALAVLTPLGYVPRLADASIVPLYPLGFPALAAVGLPLELAPYVVAPLMAVVVLVLVHRIAHHWTGSRTAAWLATSLTAWNPLVMTYATQPMSDIPATGWLLTAVWLLVRDTPRPLLAGLAAGVSFLTRPGGLGAIAAVALLTAVRTPPRAPALRRFAAGLAPCVALQALLQWRLFGSPWHTGYGSLDTLFAGTTVASNALIYAQAFVSVHTFAWIVLVLAGLYALGTSRALWVLVLLTASLTPYLLYFRFDHWETLRFILPAVVILNVAAAAGTTALLSRVLGDPWRGIATIAVAALAIAHAGTFLRAEGVPLLMEQERRYPLTAEWIERYTPSGTLVLAGQHSGSIRHYAGRTTLRWDLLNPVDLEPVVQEARRRGVAVYAALDREELAPFRERFEASLAASPTDARRVTLLPGAQIRDVQIWELSPSEVTR